MIMTQLFDILNSEGTILALYQNDEHEFYFGAILKDGSGRIFFNVSKSQLFDYYHSKLTLVDVLNNSSDFIVRHMFRKESKAYFKEDVLELLQGGSKFYNSYNNSMKSNEFKAWLDNN
jgi:hypothetical protein